jgi:hypothetical protein
VKKLAIPDAASMGASEGLHGPLFPSQAQPVGAYGGDRHVAIMASAGARLLNAFTAQIETMRRLR